MRDGGDLLDTVFLAKQLEFFPNVFATIVGMQLLDYLAAKLGL